MTERHLVDRFSSPAQQRPVARRDRGRARATAGDALAKDWEKSLGYRDRPATGSTLGIALDELAADLGDRTTHTDPACVKIDIFDPRPDEFSEAKSGVGQEHDGNIGRPHGCC